MIDLRAPANTGMFDSDSRENFLPRGQYDTKPNQNDGQYDEAKSSENQWPGNRDSDFTLAFVIIA